MARQSQLAALHNLSNAAGVEAIRRVYPGPPSLGGATDRAILTRAVAYIPDVRGDPEYPYQDLAQAAGYRSHLSVPILRHGQPVGAITVARSSLTHSPSGKLRYSRPLPIKR